MGVCGVFGALWFQVLVSRVVKKSSKHIKECSPGLLSDSDGWQFGHVHFNTQF